MRIATALSYQQDSKMKIIIIFYCISFLDYSHLRHNISIEMDLCGS